MSVLQPTAADKSPLQELEAALQQRVMARWAAWWARMAAEGLPTDLGALERAVEQFVHQVGQQLVAVLATAVQPTNRPTCGVCHAPLRCVDPARPITVRGIFGDYRLERAYYVCPAGHGSATPADAAWGLGPARVTPRLAERLCRLVVEVPFERAATLAAELWGVAVDGETVRRVAEGVGQVAEATEQAAQAAVRAGQVPAPTGPGPAGLLVALDGAMVHTDGAWHEVQVGVCQALQPTARGTWEPTGAPDYCVEVGSRTAFWPRLYAHAAAAGVESRTCHLIALIGDGAHWIWEDAGAYFGGPGKQVVEILDFYHAAEHVWAVAHALYPADEAAAAAWADPLVAALRDQGPAPVQAALAMLAPPDPAAAAVVARERGYFAYHADRMDYPRYRRHGLPIGSGTVESACKVVLKQRLSQGGMRWSRVGAQAVATLRAWHRSGRWAAFWASRPLTQRVPPKRRCAA
ncbi:MAG: ISKra4 family transposase [Firmicutes bacterium]|nr:ISKra4 family transposase [Bacillota bacterium]